MKPLRILFAFLLLSGTALADEPTVTLKDGTVLKDFRVLNESPESLMVRHSEGLENIHFERFPLEIQEKYGYDPKNIAQRQARAQEEERQKEAERLKEETEVKIITILRWEAIRAGLNIIQVLEEGVLARGHGTKKISFHERFTGFDIDFENPIFLERDTEGLIDGEQISVLVMWPVGTYSYISAAGSRRTVQKFTESPTSFLKAYEDGVITEAIKNMNLFSDSDSGTTDSKLDSKLILETIGLSTD